MHNKLVKSDDEWRSQLTDEQYRVTRHAGTERAFTGIYWDHKEEGVYRCICCDTKLFQSDAKFDSGCGWPSFVAPASDGAVDERHDHSHGMIRTEVVCHQCDAHLGHVFPDGPRNRGGLRYCINSASLRFDGESGDET